MIDSSEPLKWPMSLLANANLGKGVVGTNSNITWEGANPRQSLPTAFVPCKQHLERGNKNDNYQRCCGSGETCDQLYSYCDN